MGLERIKCLYSELREVIEDLGSDDEEIEEELTFRYYCPDPGFQYTITLYFDLELKINKNFGKKICSLIVSKEGPEEMDGGICMARRKIYTEAVDDFRVVSSYCSSFISPSFEAGGINLIDNRTIRIEEENVDLPPNMRENADKVISNHMLCLKMIPTSGPFFIQEIFDGSPSVFYMLDESIIKKYGEKIKEAINLVFAIQRECFFI